MQNETVSYALSLQGKSKFDEASRNLFMEYGAKSDGKLFNGQQPRDYFMMLQDYEKIVEDLDQPFVWSQVTNFSNLVNSKSVEQGVGNHSKIKEQNDEETLEIDYGPHRQIKSVAVNTGSSKYDPQKQWNACVFGECGQGKSTILNEIVKIVEKKFDLKENHGCKFKSMKSFQSVTSSVLLGSVGNMNLIDTPGLNDPNAALSDKNIFIEIIKTLSGQIYDQKQGLSSLILCVMPNESQRIRESTIQALHNMFFMFNCLDLRTDITKLPKFNVIINNVSLYDETYNESFFQNQQSVIDSNNILTKEKRVQDIKLQLKAAAKDFYLTQKVSDDIQFGKDAWKDLKDEVCEDDDYKEDSWYQELAYHQKELLEDLKQIQLDIGIRNSIEPQQNYVRAQKLEERIDDLLPSENFYCFKIFQGDDERTAKRNEIEKNELYRLIENQIDYERFYLKEGQLEPLYLTEDERKLLTEGMDYSIDRIIAEVENSHNLTQEITGIPSYNHYSRMENIASFRVKFGKYLHEKPQIFQKCSFHGLLLAKEILAKAREEVNELCLKDLANQIKQEQQELKRLKTNRIQSTRNFFSQQTTLKQQENIPEEEEDFKSDSDSIKTSIESQENEETESFSSEKSQSLKSIKEKGKQEQTHQNESSPIISDKRTFVDSKYRRAIIELQAKNRLLQAKKQELEKQKQTQTQTQAQHIQKLEAHVQFKKAQYQARLKDLKSQYKDLQAPPKPKRQSFMNHTSNLFSPRRTAQQSKYIKTDILSSQHSEEFELSPLTYLYK